ncbi:MAG: 4-hydroxythreonine-4-phosphate dehydrogenase [Verrucomicrobiota bacterium]
MISSDSAPPTIAIAMGDCGGIGPEVILKAIAAELPHDLVRYLIVGDGELLTRLNQDLALNIPVVPLEARDARTRVSWLNPAPAVPPSEKSHAIPGEAGCVEHARLALCWLKKGAALCLEGEAHALVTAPVNKESIIRSGENDFVGQTELLSALAQTDRTAMMLLGHDDRGRWLRVALATIHLPIARVAMSLTREKVLLAIELAAQACRELGLARTRVAVCGLNPHAGEGGKMGTEEITTVTPAVEMARGLGIDVVGPLAADTLFHYALRGDYDAIVAMYHDQGLAPLKMIAFDTGVNWTLGLPFIRTSPDHGTAYDIAGKGVANASSMIAALRLAKQLAHARSSSSR